MIAKNLQTIRENLADAAIAAGRRPEEIALVAVSKTVDTDRVQEAIAAGQMDFGENYAQEFRKKAEEIKNDIKWHFIGQLQSNKVKYIIEEVYLIQSVDRLSLAKEINKRAGNIGKVADVLLQVYLPQQDGRGGAGIEETQKLLADCGGLEHIRVKGLMSVAPFGMDASGNERYFEAVHALFEKLKQECPENAQMQTLSMGMTADYHEAIKHGSNMVRIGTAIFGGR